MPPGPCTPPQQQLRQERVRKLRGIIANEREEETSAEGAEDAQKQGQKEERRTNDDQVAVTYGEGVGGGKLAILDETFAEDETEVGSTGKKCTKLMNRYLWSLAEKRLQAGYDISLPPSRDNQVWSKLLLVLL